MILKMLTEFSLWEPMALTQNGDALYLKEGGAATYYHYLPSYISPIHSTWEGVLLYHLLPATAITRLKAEDRIWIGLDAMTDSEMRQSFTLRIDSVRQHTNRPSCIKTSLSLGQYPLSEIASERKKNCFADCCYCHFLAPHVVHDLRSS